MVLLILLLLTCIIQSFFLTTSLIASGENVIETWDFFFIMNITSFVCALGIEKILHIGFLMYMLSIELFFIGYFLKKNKSFNLLAPLLVSMLLPAMVLYLLLFGSQSWEIAICLGAVVVALLITGIRYAAYIYILIALPVVFQLGMLLFNIADKLQFLHYSLEGSPITFFSEVGILIWLLFSLFVVYLSKKNTNTISDGDIEKLEYFRVKHNATKATS